MSFWWQEQHSAAYRLWVSASSCVLLLLLFPTDPPRFHRFNCKPLTSLYRQCPHLKRSRFLQVTDSKSLFYFSVRSLRFIQHFGQFTRHSKSVTSFFRTKRDNNKALVTVEWSWRAHQPYVTRHRNQIWCSRWRAKYPQIKVSYPGPRGFSWFFSAWDERTRAAVREAANSSRRAARKKNMKNDLVHPGV